MNVALILSGGTGTRLGADIPKQYIEVGGKPIISYCIETISEHNKIDAIQIVADSSWHNKKKTLSQESLRTGLRWLSRRNGTYPLS